MLFRPFWSDEQSRQLDMSKPDLTEGTGKNEGRDIAQRAAEELQRLASAPLDPGLYVVATPIGNLGDITLRALAVLARADVIYCEDTRHSRTLLSHFALKRPVQPYHEHNAEEQRPRILAELARGKRIALISDAGTPLISDPGYKLVRDVVGAGHLVTSLPGPSAALAALTSSGLPTDSFLFAGFLPAKSQARRTRLEAFAAVPATLVFFEAASRAAGAIADMADVLGNRLGVVARELTKLHEDIRRAPLATLAAQMADAKLRGEIVILTGPPIEADVSDEVICEHLAKALEKTSLRDAARSTAEKLSVPKARAYDLGLALKREKE